MVTLPQALRVAVRADAGSSIGAGHVVRCLALVHPLRALGHEVHFICRAHQGHLAAVIEAQGIEVHLLPAGPVAGRTGEPSAESRWLGTEWETDARETGEVLATLQPAWLVVDHYGIDARWEAAVQAHIGALVAIDDLANRPHASRWLVDQNLQPRAQRYHALVPPNCRTLLGPRFALLRPEFSRRRATRAASDGTVHRLLACAGGTDPSDLLSKTVLAWSELPAQARPMLDVVVGLASPNLQRLRELCEGLSGCTLHVQIDDVAELMAQADLMVLAAGSMNWERCCMGLPGIVCATADNQSSNLQELARARTAIAVGQAANLSVRELAAWLRRLCKRPGLLRRMGDRGRRLVDGHGAFRVAIAMTAERLTLRSATDLDAAPTWVWRNAESTRRHFVNPAPVALESHLAWWRAAVADSGRTLLVAQVGTAAVGVLRLDRVGEQATVSIYLDPRLTGLNLGVRILRAGQRWLVSEGSRTRRLLAIILPGNHASERAFAEAGFRRAGEHWVWEA